MAKSEVWRHFEMGRAEDKCKVGKCRLCDEEQAVVLRCSGNSTIGLWKHLEKKHKDEHDKLKRRTDVQNPKPKEKQKQPTITTLLSSTVPYGPNHRKQKEFDQNIKQQFINDCLPFRMAESPSFRKTIADLDPRIRVKTARTYAKYLRADEQKVKKHVKRLVRTKSSLLIGLTADMWDDRKANSFCSLTAHYIDDNFQLVRAVPAIKFFGTGRHTSENIAEVLKSEIESVKKDGALAVLVTDSTNNMKKARNILKESEITDETFGCVIHTVQNAIKDAFKNTPGVKKVVVKAKKLTKHFRKSPKASNYMKSACEKSGHQFTRMKTSIEIRWNSEHDALERLLHHQECVELMDRKRLLDDVSHIIPNRIEWRILESVTKILKPVKICTKVFENQSEPSVNRVAEELFNVEEQLKDVIGDVTEHMYVKHFAKNLRRSLQRRFPDYGLNEKIFGFANFLDSRLKGIHLEQVGAMEKYTEAVTKAIAGSGEDGMEDILEVDQSNNNNAPQVKVTPTEKLLRKKFDPISNVFETKSKGEVAAEKELDLYRSLPICTEKDGVLCWWKDHSEVMPRLATFAKHILAVPASTSSSEQLFSIAGLFDTVKRGNMGVDTLETLAMLKANQKLLMQNGIDLESNDAEESPSNELSEDSDMEEDGESGMEEDGDSDMEEDGDSDMEEDGDSDVEEDGDSDRDQVNVEGQESDTELGIEVESGVENEETNGEV